MATPLPRLSSAGIKSSRLLKRGSVSSCPSRAAGRWTGDRGGGGGQQHLDAYVCMCARAKHSIFHLHPSEYIIPRVSMRSTHLATAEEEKGSGTAGAKASAPCSRDGTATMAAAAARTPLDPAERGRCRRLASPFIAAEAVAAAAASHRFATACPQKCVERAGVGSIPHHKLHGLVVASTTEAAAALLLSRLLNDKTTAMLLPSFPPAATRGLSTPTAPCRSSASFKPHAPLARIGQLLVEEPTQSPQVVAKHSPSDGREGVGLCEGVWCGCMCEGGLCAPILPYEEHDKR